MRIVAGAWRGRALLVPAGSETRPTADRVRQAVFDMLMHAPWAGRDRLVGAHVLDGFAGTGALGLEALSRGAADAVFFEIAVPALQILRKNIAACRAEDRCTVLATDIMLVRPGPPGDLVFLDPPYGKGLLPRAVDALRRAGRLAEGALLVAELGRDEPVPELGEQVAERTHGAARVVFFQLEHAQRG
jgi:16S rRNA (guanine966-N2)-methyltransferase